jgi:inositol-phosphate transport system ATP-binding protein
MRILLENITKRFDEVTVIADMNLEIRDGEMLALLGPSGCGKSTTLLAICGIYALDGGRILFGDEDVSRKRPQERNVGVTFQFYALYPHMTASENISFPLEARGESADEIRRKVGDIAALVHIDELLQRMPAQLSGGQQQRVALARALVREPHVLLLDEPLANLDAKLRLEMRSEIRRIQQETGVTAVLVTHDQVEAMSMCDRIAIMDNGQIIQTAQPRQMYGDPASDFVAGFLGNPPITFLDGRVEDGHFVVPGSDVKLAMPDGFVGLEHGQKVKLGVRPEFFHPNGSAPVSGRVSFVEHQGRETLYDVTLADGSILRSIQTASDGINLGDAVRWGIDMNRVLVFDETGSRV